MPEFESAAGVAGRSPAPAASPARPVRCFKLRFAAPRELGRSHVSAIRPLSLPTPLTDKPYAREHSPPEEAGVRRALRAVRERFASGPRDTHARPLTTAHEYGWWCSGGAAPWADADSGRYQQHHTRQSAWLRERLRVLGADAAAGLKRH